MWRDADYVLTTLNKIKKQSALALLKPQTLGKGTAALDEALSLEIELAKFADEKGIAL